MNTKGILMVLTLASIVVGFVPSLIYWLFFKKSLEEGSKNYLTSLLNFEITLALIGIIFGAISGPFAGFVAGLLSLINLIFIIIATLNIANDKAYKFPIAIPLFK